MVYQYAAYTEEGEIVKGKLTAASEATATEMLDYAGYQVISLKPFVPFLSLGKISFSSLSVKTNDIILFYRELAMLLESGIGIVTSLELLQTQLANRTLKKVLNEIISDLRSGSQLSISMAKHPNIFSPMYCRLLGLGEQGGSLETELRQIADYMEKESTTTKKIKNALTYPVITSVVTVLAVGILVTFVLPTFGSLYQSLGVELPAPVRILIDLSNFIKSYGVYFLLASIVIALAIRRYIKTEKGRYQKDKLTLKVPLLGKVVHLSQLARCCRSISLLFHSGLPLTEVISLVIEGTGNKTIALALTEVQQSMVKGEGLSQPMTKNPLFLPMMVQMVKVGEETGSLDTTLMAVAQSYEAEAEDKTRTLIELIQPTMTLFIGLIVGLLAMSLTSGMYSLYGQGF